MDLSSETDVLRQALVEAGKIIDAIAAQGFETKDKGGQDPVTTADLAADDILKKRLLGAFPDDGWLSEETRDDPVRLTKKRVWIVDPMDGTREYVLRIPEYAVSVALVIDGRPILAGIYNPQTDELVMAERGKGVTLNGAPDPAPAPVGEKLSILASRSECKRGQFAPIEPHADVIITGSIAYKLGLVAAGKANAVISLAPKNEWDFAAGVLLIEEAGGRITDLSGDPFVLNRRQTLVNGIVAAPAGIFDRTARLVELAAAAGTIST